MGNVREVWRTPYSVHYMEGEGWGQEEFPAQTVQRTQYYPSGLPWKSNTGDNPGEQAYKYGGKEFVEMHGYDSYDFQARVLYPAVGPQFMNVDPLSELTPGISPYTYCKGNPICNIDPTGMYSIYDLEGNEHIIGDNDVKDGYLDADHTNVTNNSQDIVKPVSLIEDIKKEFLNFFGWGLNPDDVKNRDKIEDGSINRQKAAKVIDKANKFLIVNGTLFFVGEGAAYCISRYGGAVLVRIVSKRIGESGITVLGTYNGARGGYVAVAEQMGANYFQIPNWAWNMLGKSEQWSANVRFLNASIERGDSFILSSSAFSAKQGTSFYKEIQYLLSKGYKITTDGMSLFKP